MSSSEFYQRRVEAAAAVPADQRTQDVSAFLDAVALADAAAALLPLPPRQQQQLEQEGPMDQLALMGALAASLQPKTQPEADAEMAAVLGYLSFSYAALQGQPRPLNHPRFNATERARVDAVLGGQALAIADLEVTFEPAEGGAQAEQETIRGMREEGLDVRQAADGSLAVTHNALEMLLLGAGGSGGEPPRDMRAVVHALLLASVLGTQSRPGPAARVLRKLSPVFEQPAALAGLGRELAAVQSRRGEAAPRLPTAQQLHKLWLRMRVRDARARGVASTSLRQWGVEAAEKLAALDAANPRACQELALSRLDSMRPLEAAAMRGGGLPAGYVPMYESQIMSAYKKGLGAARAANNSYLTAYFAFQLAIDASRFCCRAWQPAQAAALLREGEAAYGAIKKLLPEEWISDLKSEREAARAFRDLLQAHEAESPQAWSAAIQARLIGSMESRFYSAERAKMNSSLHRKCDGCGSKALAVQFCGGCKNTAYCSRECQRAHWAEHKQACKEAQAARGSGSGAGARQA